MSGDTIQGAWPSSLPSLVEVRAWISSVLPGRPDVTGPTRMYAARAWGAVAEFVLPASRDAIIFKICLLPLYSASPVIHELLARYCPTHVPELLAWHEQRGETMMLFRPFSGRTVRSLHHIDALVAMARTLAHIQSIIAGVPKEEIALLPHLPIEHLPRLFDEIMQEIADKYIPTWSADDWEAASRYHIPRDILGCVASYRRDVVDWAAQLISAGWPLSIDHVDFHADNAVQTDEGRLLIYDWDEATVSCPFFSLDRLLADARVFDGDVTEDTKFMPVQTRTATLYTPSESAVRQAYIEVLPWGTLAERGHAVDVALCLSPLKALHEGKMAEDALGQKTASPLTAWAVSRALQRWAFMRSTPPRCSAVTT